MLKIRICVALITLLIGCSGRPIPQLLAAFSQKEADTRMQVPASKVDKQSAREEYIHPSTAGTLEESIVLASNNEAHGVTEEQIPRASERSPDKALVPLITKEEPKLESHSYPVPTETFAKPPASQKIAENPIQKKSISESPAEINNDRQEYLEEAERDIMEEALVLLNESQNYWVNGDIEDALEMLDQAYAILLDANGNPDIARQKDDLRLMISRRILSIYNSIQTVAKGKRSEIPVVINADVEKEIRQFQTVERDFFITSYQRSSMYRPIILRELKKAGLPEELAWLPLVESGFKITALSTARALGLWQFIPSTGYKYGLNRDEWVDERMDIEKSTRAAIDYLKELHTMFGDWLTVLAAYNCGEGRVIRTIASQHISYLDRFWDLYQKLPYETARYVPRFLATILIVREPAKYGIDLGSAPKTSALSYEVVEVNKPMRLQDIAQKLEAPEEILNILNAELRHRITPDKPYRLKVPTELADRCAKIIDQISQVEAPRISLLTKRGAVIRHKVREGETISSVANKYKISVATLVSYNHLPRKKRLTPGQRLDVPIQAARSVISSSTTKKSEKILRHKVQKGDTLVSLAKKYDTSVSELKKSNSLRSDALKTGQVLRIERMIAEGNDKLRGEGHDGVARTKGGISPVARKGSDTNITKKYTVKKGDSLNKIARENNISLNKLLDLNKLVAKESIHPGQTILIQ